MPNIRGLVSDPQFRALPVERQRTLLLRTKANPAFVDELLGISPELEAQREAIVAPARAGAAARSGPAGPDEPRFYGAPEDPRNIAEAGKFRGTAAAAGPSAAILASVAAGPVLGVAGRAPGLIGSAARFGAAHPTATVAAASAAPKALRGDIQGAVTEGALTAAGLKGGSGLLRFLGRFKGAGGAAAKEALGAAGAKAGGAVASEGQNMAQNILRWRTEHKLSDGQIIDSLRQVYGIARPQATEILKLLGS